MQVGRADSRQILHCIQLGQQPVEIRGILMDCEMDTRYATSIAGLTDFDSALRHGKSIAKEVGHAPLRKGFWARGATRRGSCHSALKGEGGACPTFVNMQPEFQQGHVARSLSSKSQRPGFDHDPSWFLSEQR